MVIILFVSKLKKPVRYLISLVKKGDFSLIVDQKMSITYKMPFMSGSCHLDRALNDKFSVECLF